MHCRKLRKENKSKTIRLPSWLSLKEYACNAGDPLQCRRSSAMQEALVQSLGWKDPLEKEIATQSSILGWEILLEEPGRLQCKGSRRVKYD